MYFSTIEHFYLRFVEFSLGKIAKKWENQLFIIYLIRYSVKFYFLIDINVSQAYLFKNFLK